MAKYRQIHTTFWGDPFVEDLDSEQKLFYIYLLTNSRTTQCGIYEITKKTISNELGYNDIKKVDELLNFFITNCKILYCEETKEIFLLNWIKYNWIDSKPVRGCIYKELQLVKNIEYIDRYDTLLIPYGYSINTLVLDKKDGSNTVKNDDTVNNNKNYPIGTVSIPYAETMDRLGGRREEEVEKKRKEVEVEETEKTSNLVDDKMNNIFNSDLKNKNDMSGYYHPNIYAGKELTIEQYMTMKKIDLYKTGFKKVITEGAD